jgi:hypothetical protein
MWEAITTGDMQIAEGHYQRKVDNSHFILQGSHIYFTGTRGTITVTATNPDFDGVPYTCSYTINYHIGINSTKWDFNSKQYTLNGNKWNGTEERYKNNQNAPIFHRVNGGLNDDMGKVIAEGAGLIVSADNKDFGGNNPEGNTPHVDRYVLMGEGGTITIPASIFSGYTNKPRIRVKMDRWGGNECYLTITNGEDALGTHIQGTGAYQIGGSSWWGNKGDNNYRGEYHFIVHNRSNDFSIKVENNQSQCLKILSIEVYDSDEIITENSILGDRYQFGNIEGETVKEGSFNLHFRGRDEKTVINPSTISTTGTVTCNNSNLATGGNYDLIAHKYTSNVGEFGTFRFRIDCWTQDRNGSGTRYCTDYAWRTNSVGYMQKRGYPYTWDFTDVKIYASDGMAKESQYTASASNVKSNSVDYNPVARCLWKENGGNYELQLAADAGHNVHYCGDTQLWYGDHIIPELQYLAFTPVNYDAVYDGALTITSEGLKFDQNIRDWWLWRIMIPSVPTNGVIYVRAKETRDDSFCNVGYYYGDATNKTNKSLFNADADGTTNVARKFATSDGDVIYVVPAPSSETNVTLFFTGVIVKKISVSTDFKTVNDLGYASESRDHEIDPELMGYMTGTGLTAYTVSEVTYGDNAGDIPSIKLKAVQTNNVIGSATHHDNNAYIIYNKDEAVNGTKAVKALDGGFHLFVPDMHDKTKMADGITDATDAQKSRLDVSGNGLRAWLPSSPTTEAMCQTYTYTTGTDGSITATGAEEGVGEYTTYVLSSKGTNTVTGQTETGVERFRRVKAGTKAGNNKAYLPLLTENVKPKAGASAKGMFAIVFVDEEEGTETTSLNGVESIERTYNDSSYYTLGGVKVQNPTKKGIYIKNGKKIIIK